MLKKPISYKAAQFTESVIREMTRLAMEHDAINLSQGYPDFPAPDILKKAASDAIFSGATPRYVQLRRPDWSFDEAELAAAFNNNTKAIIINTPNNPTGKVFSREELQFIAELCQKWDVLAITDEIYEHILYDGAKHVSPITLDGMRERTIVVNGMSKTFSVTGWRVGYIIAPPGITGAIRKMHDFITVGAPAPLQEAGCIALRLPDSYFADLAAHYQQRRDRLMKMLKDAALNPMLPKGAYYIMCDIGKW